MGKGKFQKHDTKTAETLKRFSPLELFCANACLCAPGVFTRACPVTLWWRQSGEDHLSRGGPCWAGGEGWQSSGLCPAQILAHRSRGNAEGGGKEKKKQGGRNRGPHHSLPRRLWGAGLASGAGHRGPMAFPVSCFSFPIFHARSRDLLGQAFAGVKNMGTNQHSLRPLGA